MIIPPAIALIAWVPISLCFFWCRPVRQAILITFVAGWALLPSANYVASSAVFPYWILGSSLPAGYFFTKASVVGISGLIGILLFDRRVLMEFKLSLWDLPMLIWCAVPLLSAIANPEVFLAGIRGAIYQLLSWGVPYICGRLYFSEKASLLLAAKAFVVAGIAYVPICLLEFFTGPQLYARIYGYQPYRWVGAQRYLGFRPIGFLEDGNQLGIWMASSALIALGLWKWRETNAILRIPIAWVAATLFVVTLFCQSGGSILLLVALLPFILVSHRYLPRVLAMLLMLGVLSFAGLRLANVVSLHTLVSQNGAAHSAAGYLKRLQRGSFGWRLSQDERYVGTALESPVLGTGEWDWWKGSLSRPWGLWLLAFGMYGIFGLLALEGMLVIPVARVVLFPMARSTLDGYKLRYILAAAILMSTIDGLLNSAMILPLVLLVGGLIPLPKSSAAADMEQPNLKVMQLQ